MTNIEDQTATPAANGRHMRGLIWLCGVLMVLVSTAIVYFVWMMSELYSHKSIPNLIVYRYLAAKNVDTFSKGLRILDRSEWLGEPPSSVQELIAPISHVIIHHTATEGCEREVSAV